MQPRPWPKVPELTAQVARAVAARGPYPLAMRVRDELGELFADARLDAWRNGHPLDRPRVSHLAHLGLPLAA
ncbi:hypothetical protein ABZY81_00640 [Streptomyces sp. NPDC006514]|uniref:hypothetical protein n=1 Tax=Streptomyces sp. NPDC006514 TaxID=3154308 RepID=UPI0033B62AA2